MKRLFLILSLTWVTLFAANSQAQSVTTYTGTIKDLSNATVTSGKVTFTLKPGVDTTVSGSARFVPQTIVCKITASGLKAEDGSSACTVVANTSLVPSGTFFQVEICPYFACTSKFNGFSIGGTVDISTMVPTPATAPMSSLVSTIGDQVIAGNKTFSGSLSVDGNVQYRVAAWGDSLTEGAGGTPYPTQLSALAKIPVYNGGVGGEGSTSIKNRMVAATDKHGYITIIWAGRNNFNSPTTVKADIATMVSSISVPQRYVVLSILGASDDSSPSLATIAQLNSDLASIYSGKYLNVCTVLNCANGVTDASLRSDNIHLNSSGYAAVAGLLSTWVQSNSAAGMTLVPNLGSVGGMFAAPPPIGVDIPPVVNASSVTSPAYWFDGSTKIQKASDGSIQVNRPIFANPINAGDPANGAVDLGYNSYPWHNLYLSNAAFMRTLTVSDPNGDIPGTSLFVANDNSVQIGTRLIAPGEPNTVDIGTSGNYRFRNLYLSGAINATGMTLTRSGVDVFKIALDNSVEVDSKLIASPDNTIDIGGAGAYRFRNIYAGTSVITPKLAGVTDTGIVTNLNADTLDGFHAGNASTGKAMCWKDSTHLGYCSTVVDSAGACTCN